MRLRFVCSRTGAARRSRPPMRPSSPPNRTLETLLSARPMVVRVSRQRLTAFLCGPWGCEGAILFATEPARRPAPGTGVLQEQVSGAALGTRCCRTEDHGTCVSCWKNSPPCIARCARRGRACGAGDSRVAGRAPALDGDHCRRLRAWARGWPASMRRPRAARGTVVAAAVILHPRRHSGLADSKGALAQERARLAPIIAHAPGVGDRLGRSRRDRLPEHTGGHAARMRRALLACPCVRRT